MTRRESMALLILAFIVISLGGFIAFGPWGLMTCGAALATFALLVSEIPEDTRAEPTSVAHSSRQAKRTLPL
jgi:hypothetical protein